MVDTYLRYGISDDLALRLSIMGIPKTTLEKTSKKNLKEKYGLTDSEIVQVKDAIQRKPIDENVVSDLLERSNYTCCICKGVKGKSYIIHHIKEYAISQDNNYYNLAVLCPHDHDLAHKKGKSLTMALSEDEIYKAKRDWEKKVQKLNLEKASRNGNIIEIDFLNVPRILEVCIELFSKIPETPYTQELYSKSLITDEGYLNEATISELNKNPATPMIFFAPYGSALLRFHYYDVFKSLLHHLSFIDLDSLLNKTAVKSGIVGQYCYYVGGLYSSRLPEEIMDTSDMMKFYFKKKPFIVEWLVDPKYFCSNSAKHRTFHRGVYMIFGKIRNVNIETVDRKDQIVVDIRPYCFGLPELQKDRVPSIAYRDKFDDLFEEDNDIF